MLKTRQLLTALAVAAIALTGCGSTDTAKDEAARAHVEANKEAMDPVIVSDPSPSEPEPVETPERDPEPIEGVEFENTWAEKQLRDYMVYQGANSLEGFSKHSPERNIVAVTNPSEGVVRFEVRDLDYEAEGWFIDGLAVNYMSFTGCAADDVDAVIVETVGGGEKVTQEGCG